MFQGPYPIARRRCRRRRRISVPYTTKPLMRQLMQGSCEHTCIHHMKCTGFHGNSYGVWAKQELSSHCTGARK